MRRYQQVKDIESDSVDDITVSEDEGEETFVDRKLTFLSEARDGFVVAQKTSLQVACWTTVFSAFAVVVNRHELSAKGFPPSSILCNVLFTVGSDLGSTLNNIYYGVIGTFIAWITNWTFLGFFPDAYTGENDSVFWLALAVIFLYTFAVTLCKINETVRFWALLNFTGGYAMDLVNPSVNGENLSGNFKLNYLGTAENAFILYLIGAALAFIIFLIPPITSLYRSQNRVVVIMKEMSDLIKRVHHYYSGNTQTLECNYIKEDFKILRARLAEAENYGVSSWYESCGRSKKRYMMLKLVHLIKDLMEYAEPLLEVISKEDFKESHTIMMRYVRSPLGKVLNCTMDIVQKLIAAAEDGDIDQDERNHLEEDISRMPALVEHVQNKVVEATREFGSKRIQDEVLGEHYMVLTICRMAQLTMDEAKEFFVEGSVDDDIASAFRNSIKGLCHFNQGDLKWALRSSVCLLVNFMIGFIGWCAAENLVQVAAGEEKPVCFIRRYTAGLANINVVLLSRYGGGTLKAALDRVSAVVLASVVGQVGYVAFGWCTDTSRILTLISVFLVSWIFMYLNFDGDSNTASIAQRLAAITVSSLMADCSDKSSTASTYSGKYHDLSEIIIGVIVMNLFDMIVGDESAQIQASERLTEAVKGYEKAPLVLRCHWVKPL
ncbi:unnamed protein product [Effrenium voratum]|nr:unnamed protein product [Effrenium voratum]